MTAERGIALSYLRSQKRRGILLVLGVVLAVALVSTLFSMLDVLRRYEVAQASESGVFHVAAQNCTPAQARQLMQRVEISAGGRSLTVQKTALVAGRVKAVVRGCDAGGAAQLNLKLESGRLPQKDGEIALERWVADEIRPGLAPGDKLAVQLAGGAEKTCTVSGILEDNLGNRGVSPILTCTLSEAEHLAGTDRTTVMIQLKNGVDVDGFVAAVSRDEQIPTKDLAQHTLLLAALGRSRNQNVKYVYYVGAFLAALVLFAAYMMIYNAFNISVAHRVRQFGMLRALGVTPAQIRRIVRSEAGYVSLFGVLPGLVVGVVVSNLLLLFLRRIMPEYFIAGGPALFLSWVSLAVGAAAGMADTVVSSFIPARRAGKVSPIEAMASFGGAAARKRTARSLAARWLPVEAALALRWQLMKKRTFFAISFSLSIGILLLLCFAPALELFRDGTEPHYNVGDLCVASDRQNRAFPQSFISSVEKLPGVASVYPKRIASVDATFPYSYLGDSYSGSLKEGWRRVEKDGSGLVKPVGKVSLVGLTDADLATLSSRMVLGRADPQSLDAKNGVVLILNVNGGAFDVGDLKPGEYVTVGSKKLLIEGVARWDAVADVYDKNAFFGMYATDKVLDSVAPAEDNFLSVTLSHGADSSAVVGRIKAFAPAGAQYLDLAESQSVSRRLMLIVDVFIYGFVAVIALIGVLNIINTMSTNILSRTRELGLLRAGGMTMGQVGAMVGCEAGLYGLLAIMIGLAAGIPLNRFFYTLLVGQTFGLPWSLHWGVAAACVAVTAAAVALSLLSPLSTVKKLEVTRAVTVE